LWGPACALAAGKLRQAGAVELLDELVKVGFNQPELFDGQLEVAFADDPRWPEIAARMAASDVPPPIVLIEWPVLNPSARRHLATLGPGWRPETKRWGSMSAAAGLPWSTYGWIPLESRRPS
jgi:hypothetical protein